MFHLQQRSQFFHKCFTSPPLPYIQKCKAPYLHIYFQTPLRESQIPFFSLEVLEDLELHVLLWEPRTYQGHVPKLFPSFDVLQCEQATDQTFPIYLITETQLTIFTSSYVILHE